MGFNGEAPAQSRGLPLSPKAAEVLAFLEKRSAILSAAPMGDADADEVPEVDMRLLRALYEPALAIAAAVNLVRQGNLGMAPFVGAAGSVLTQALEPLVEHFGDRETTFEQVFERIGIPVVPFADLPDAPDVETPAVEPLEQRELADAEAAAEEATWD